MSVSLKSEDRHKDDKDDTCLRHLLPARHLLEPIPSQLHSLAPAKEGSKKKSRIEYVKGACLTGQKAVEKGTGARGRKLD